MNEDIQFQEQNGWGIITLTRPKALNALTHDMVIAMRAHLQRWRNDDGISAVLVRGDGEKAFCAGGDIRWLYETAQNDHASACRFFYDEYLNNAEIFHFPKPYVALIDGITMGGGVGISVHGSFRVAGDRTLFAMPETGIGLFPDVGGGYFLPRLKDGLGLYYALTGARAGGADCVKAGIATHFVPTEKQPHLLEKLTGQLVSLENGHSEVQSILDGFGVSVEDAPVEAHRARIAEAFQGVGSVEDIVSRLASSPDDFDQKTLQTLSRMSPASLLLTFEQMHRGATLEFNDVMKMEYRIVNRVMKGRDFFEGVRALIIDKDKSPRWEPHTLAEVNREHIMNYFNPLNVEELPL